jgi:putative spermidine/putrescine transport system substrate-binding protein
MTNDRNHLSVLPERRAVLKGAAALAATALAPRAGAAADANLYVNTWGGSWTDAQKVAYFEPMKKALGINCIPVTPVSFAKLKAEVESGVYDWDITSLGAVEYWQAVHEKLLEPVDRSVMDPAAISQGRVFDYGADDVRIASLLTYRKDKFPNGGPASWQDFWDVKRFPGPRSLQNQAWTCMGFALLADGVPLDKLYPLDIDRALHKLDEIKPHITVWWTQGSQSQELLRDGQVDMMAIWNARAAELIQEKVPLEMVWNGAESEIGKWSVAKGSPRAKLGWRAVNFVTGAKPQAEFCQRMLYGPANPASFALLPPGLASQLPGYPAIAKLGFEPDSAWLAPRVAEIKDRWSQWIAS